MTGSELLASLRARGVRVDVDAQGLRIAARPGLLTDADRAALRQHKAALLTLAGNEARQGRQDRQELHLGQGGGLDADPAPASPCGLCRGVLWWDPTWNAGAWLCPRCAATPRPSLRAVYDDLTAAERLRLADDARHGDRLAGLLLLAVDPEASA